MSKRTVSVDYVDGKPAHFSKVRWAGTLEVIKGLKTILIEIDAEKEKTEGLLVFHGGREEYVDVLHISSTYKITEG